MTVRRIRIRTLVAILVVALAAAIAAIVIGTRGSDGWRFRYISEPAPSPDGSRIAFVAVHNKRGPGPLQRTLKVFGAPPATVECRLWIVDRKTGGLEMTDGKAFFETMTWRPDGAELIFVSGSHDHFMSLDRLDLQSLTASTLDDRGPHWAPRFSPDGASLGYVRARALTFTGLGSRFLLIRDVGTGGETVVSRDVHPSSWRWARDSSRVLFMDADGRKILEYRVADGATRVLYAVSNPDDHLGSGRLLLSPDERWVGVVEYLGFEGEKHFLAVDLETGSKRALFACHSLFRFDWGDAGICYVQQENDGELGDTGTLILHDVATDSSRPLATGSLRDPTWLSSTEILVVRWPKELCVIDIETGTETRIFPLP